MSLRRSPSSFRAYPKTQDVIQGRHEPHDLSPREGSKREKRAPGRRVSDELWGRVEPLLPRYRKSKAGGRPRRDSRQVLDGILVRAADRLSVESGSAGVWLAQQLAPVLPGAYEGGVFFRLWKEALWEYDALRGDRLGLAEPGWSDDEGCRWVGKNRERLGGRWKERTPIPIARKEFSFVPCP